MQCKQWDGRPHPYLPKGTDLSGCTQEQLDAIADEINDRSRKGLLDDVVKLKAAYSLVAKLRTVKCGAID